MRGLPRTVTPAPGHATAVQMKDRTESSSKTQVDRAKMLEAEYTSQQVAFIEAELTTATTFLRRATTEVEFGRHSRGTRARQGGTNSVRRSPQAIGRSPPLVFHWSGRPSRHDVGRSQITWSGSASSLTRTPSTRLSEDSNSYSPRATNCQRQRVDAALSVPHHIRHVNRPPRIAPGQRSRVTSRLPRPRWCPPHIPGTSASPSCR